MCHCRAGKAGLNETGLTSKDNDFTIVAGCGLILNTVRKIGFFKSNLKSESQQTFLKV